MGFSDVYGGQSDPQEAAQRRRGLFEEVLKKLKRQSAEDRHYQQGLARAYSSLGYLYCQNGQLEKGLMFTLRAHEFFCGNHQLRIYNLVNFILVQRILNQEPDSKVVQQIENWIRRHRDEVLQQHFLEALTQQIQLKTNS